MSVRPTTTELRPESSAPPEPAAVTAADLAELPDAQLGALRVLAEGWAKSYELVLAEVDRRSATEPLSGAIPLTQRQREILALLGDGLTIQAIARRLFLSPRTVGKHLERVYRRLGTSDRLTTVLRAQRSGLL